MPSHKQQHFVPRCHLKPFSIDQDQAGAAINLFNLSRLKHVQNAPLKGQCARHYFYGEDLVLEKLLQEIETRYGSALSKIQGNHQLADAEISDIRTFAYLQYSR